MRSLYTTHTGSTGDARSLSGQLGRYISGSGQDLSEHREEC